MDGTRRSFLKGLATAGAAAATSAVPAVASERRKAPADALGMLYDTTLCIGCKTCVVACQEANGLPRDDRRDPLHDAPLALNDRTKNIIKLYREGDRRSYMKKQCMHCIDPACAGACMIGSLQKREHGIVTWDPNRCIGCRYCQVACPFEVPRFQWDSRAPKIIKCELCNHRLPEGLEPACCEVCPRHAVIFGKYDELLAEARQRQQDHPGRYVDHIYGVDDGGGTQVIYLSHVPFEKLGLPALGSEPTGKLNRQVQHGLYQGFIAPTVLYAALGAVMLRNRRHGGGQDDKGGER
jgi:Fe-S-cluster-containing dehydrogenase component